MKKTALILTLSLAGLVTSAFAQYTSNANFSWNPVGPTSVSAGSSFMETLQLQITGSTANNQWSGFDLILESNNAPSGDFTITGTSSPLTGSGWIPSGVFGTETLTTANSDHSGYVQNPDDLGYAGPPAVADSGYSSPTGIDTLTISIAPGTPAGTYTFESTGVYTAIAGGSSSRFSDITNSGDSSSPYAIAPATFSITVVPEPATWSLFGLGAIAALGLNVLRARRKA